MDARPILVLVLVAMSTALAGCISGSPPGTALTPSPSATVLPATPSGQSCITDADCAPARCCHPAGCTHKSRAPDCSAKICTEGCEGPIDCGVAGACTVVPASSRPAVGVKLTASPQRYSPMMSSTVGIRLTPTITGFIPADPVTGLNTSDITWSPMNLEWNATFGEFVMWDAPDYRVHRIGNPVATDMKTIYWTFSGTPVSTMEPVVITVTARDMTRQGAVLGTSTVTLDWDGHTAVYVRKIT